MNNKLLNIVLVLIFVLTLFGANVQTANASAPNSPKFALPNPGIILPNPPTITATLGSRGVHPSGFCANKFKKMDDATDTSIWITDPNICKSNEDPEGTNSSLDIAYSGEVLAPIGGIIRVARYCASPTPHQIVFIQRQDGWAVGLTHILLDKNILDKNVKLNQPVYKGQPIGITVTPPAKTEGCGSGTGDHVHFTLMKWAKRNGRTEYTTQSIVNTYLAQWIVKNTSLEIDGRAPVGLRQPIVDVVKITSPHKFQLADGLKVIEGRDTGIVQTMHFVKKNDKQTWNLIAAGDGYFYIKNMQYKKCLSIENASKENFAFAKLSTCKVKNADNQKFIFVPVNNAPGKVAIQAKHSQRVLDIPVDWNGNPYSGNGDGLQIQQYDAFYGTNQQWEISKP